MLSLDYFSKAIDEGAFTDGAAVQPRCPEHGM